MIVAGENAHDRCADVARQPRQFHHVLNLDFAMRHFAVFEVRSEIGVAGEARTVLSLRASSCARSLRRAAAS